MINLTGYKAAKEIYRSTNSIVYQGHRIKDKEPIILKIPHSDHPSPNILAKYRHEYEVINSLESPGVVRPLALERKKIRWY